MSACVKAKLSIMCTSAINECNLLLDAKDHIMSKSYTAYDMKAALLVHLCSQPVQLHWSYKS